MRKIEREQKREDNKRETTKPERLRETRKNRHKDK